MCVIIVKERGHIPADVLSTSARINPHGLGIVWLDTYKIEYKKSTDWSILITSRPFIAHFRYATVGNIGVSNTHPFRCGDTDEWLMMNGTIDGLGNPTETDSKVLANVLGYMDRKTWAEQLKNYPHRFVTVNTKTKTFEIYNRDLWIKVDGVLYSKGNVVRTNLVAVYGTLKVGGHNYYNYLSDGTYIGAGQTYKRYPLVIDGLPYLVDKVNTGHHVSVDVFAVDGGTLKKLDRLEGHPSWYQRRKISIKLDDKSTVLCWIYFMQNIDITGRTLHKSFPIHKEPEYIDDVDDDYFNIDDATCVCINCYTDLEDGIFENEYFCPTCKQYYIESEIIVLRKEHYDMD